MDICHLLNVIDSSPFWSSLCSGFIIALLFGYFFPKYLDYRKRPKIHFINRITRDNKFKLTKLDNQHWREDLPLVIKNKGTTTFNSYYFHLLIPNSLNAWLEDDNGKLPGDQYIYGPWKFFSSQITAPLFPQNSVIFPCRVTIETHSKGQWSIYYSFTTEFGTSPSKAYLLETEHSKALSNKYLGELIIIAED